MKHVELSKQPETSFISPKQVFDDTPSTSNSSNNSVESVEAQHIFTIIQNTTKKSQNDLPLSTSDHKDNNNKNVDLKYEILDSKKFYDELDKFYILLSSNIPENKELSNSTIYGLRDGSPFSSSG